MISWTYLVVSLLGVLLTATALFAVRRPGWISAPWFFSGWLTGELAVHHIAWQAVATVAFVASGALEERPGQVGLVVSLASWAGLVVAHRRARPTTAVVSAALADALGETEGLGEPIRGLRLNPFRSRRASVERIADIEYGPSLDRDRGRRNRLDVYRPRERQEGRLLPTLLQIHGGGWAIGDKENQALPLMYHLAEQGWVCVASNYRLSPQATFPDHIVDVKRALKWIREHGPEYGADPDFVCITGGSAGGHLCSLAALTANDPQFQPGFEDVDTSVSACVPFYGVYDFLDRHGVRRGASMRPFLERRVLKSSPDERREQWEHASPIAHVSAEAPPFFVIHGTHDSLVFVEEARLFVSALREKSQNPVAYAELHGAQHAFDMFHSPRSAEVVRAVTAFLGRVQRARSGARHAEV